MSESKHYIIPIFVPHKGCPHDCVFCNQKKITGSSKDITSEDVRITIEEYLKTIKAKGEEAFIEVSFFGGSFTGIPVEYQNELLSEATKAKLLGQIDAIRLSTRPDYINTIILDHLKLRGVDIIELGVQSMCEEVLLASERGHDVAQVIASAELIKKYNFKLGLQMMTGLPQDSKERDLHTAVEIIKLKPDFVRIYPSLIIKDTYLEQMFYNNEYEAQTVDEAVDICKALYRLFNNYNIPIIRLGLQPTDKITLGKDVVGGPFHPAFRELVESSLMNDMVYYLINIYFIKENEINIFVNPDDISKLFADKKRYFTALKLKFTYKKIVVRQNSMLKRGTIEIIVQNETKKMSLYEYLKLEK